MAFSTFMTVDSHLENPYLDHFLNLQLFHTVSPLCSVGSISVDSSNFRLTYLEMQPSTVFQTCNPRTQETKAVGSRVQVHSSNSGSHL
jgi:hypothetical protein